MNKDHLPDGWTESRIRKVLAHYEQQTEDDALAEDEAGIQPAETVMNVPHELVAEVRQLIAKRKA